jgi:hypothetical protein
MQNSTAVAVVCAPAPARLALLGEFEFSEMHSDVQRRDFCEKLAGLRKNW